MTAELDMRTYSLLDAVDLARAVREGAVTPNDLADLAREATRRVDSEIHAVVERFEDAVQPPAAGGTSALAGVPWLLKDCGSTLAGRKHACGSRLLEGWVAERDDLLAARLLAAGMIPVGRSATPEFALSVTTESRQNGATRNPWNPSRMAGGSSGGAAAAVAAGIVPLAHATDLAGSIRIPASACGIVGLKPSRGLVEPGAADDVMEHATELAVSRTVRDVAAFLDVAVNPGASTVPAGGYLATAIDARRHPPESLRIAWTTTAWGPNETHPQVAAATVAVAERLAAMGHDVLQAAPRFDYEPYFHAIATSWTAGFDRWVDRYAEALDRPVDSSTLEPVTLQLYEAAKQVRRADVERAEASLRDVRRDVLRFFEGIDVLLTPTLLRPPEPLGRYSQMTAHPDPESFFRLCEETGAMLPVFNVTGQPAISLPLAWSDDGLPLGMQLAAGLGGEATLLRIAAVLEEAIPWRERIPPIHASRA